MTADEHGLPMPQASYKTETYWEQYQSFFPAHARVTAANGPNEEWLPWRGASIHVDRFPCAASPLTMIVVHGGGGYGRLFAPIGKLLHGAGYEVLAPDLPGYGLSQAPPSLVTYQAWTDLLCDLASSEYQNTGRRVVLCGGSLGGYLAYLSAARMGDGPIAGVIAHNPCGSALIAGETAVCPQRAGASRDDAPVALLRPSDRRTETAREVVYKNGRDVERSIAKPARCRGSLWWGRTCAG